MAEIAKYMNVDIANIAKIFGISKDEITNVVGVDIPAGVPTPGDRGVFGGGTYSGFRNIIDYITISTPSNATNFGDLTVARDVLAATSDGAYDRGVFGGGNPSGHTNLIDYITISSTGDAANFGDLYSSRSN
ncbi:hypothetical protein LCGC14_2439830, partial [marine sediment metagenome]